MTAQKKMYLFVRWMILEVIMNVMGSGETKKLSVPLNSYPSNIWEAFLEHLLSFSSEHGKMSKCNLVENTID